MTVERPSLSDTQGVLSGDLLKSCSRVNVLWTWELFPPGSLRASLMGSTGRGARSFLSFDPLTSSWSEAGVQSACYSTDRHLGLRKMAWATNDIVTGKLEGKACSQESSWVFHIHWKLLLLQHGFYFLIQLVGFLRYASQLLMHLLREPHGTAHPDKRWVSVVDTIVPSLLPCSLAWLISYVFANLFCH